MPSPSPASTQTKILIVDDHPMMREGLAQLIGREADLTVCGEAEDAAQAIDAVKKMSPQLILIDITLNGRNGLELIKDVQAITPQTLILVISMHDESLYAERVLRAGGRGYVMKQEGGKKIMQAIRKVLDGQIHVSEKIAAKILDLFSGRRPQAENSPLERLTDRELEVFQLIGKALSTKEIASRLHISGKTVEVHKGHIKEKLTMKNTRELISYAARWMGSQEEPGER
jgi:DNA-binding NarL/FixJ family response regulator